MKIAVIGASGNAGSRITAELARRGHHVTAIARNPEKIASLPKVTAMQGDAHDQAGLTELLAGPRRRHQLDPLPRQRSRQADRRRQGLGRRPLSRGRRRRQPRGGPRRPAGDDAGLSGPVQGGSREGRRPSSICSGPGKGAELDLPVAVRAVHSRRAHGQVPARNRPAPDRRGRQKLDLVRGLCGRFGRRNRASGPYPQAISRSATSPRRAQWPPGRKDICLCKALGAVRLCRWRDIVCHMTLAI